MDPTNKPVTIEVRGEKWKLYFDLNTFAEFEEATELFFLEWMSGIQTAMVEAREMNDPMRMMRKIATKHVIAFVWAAYHTYDKQGNLVHPKTLTQVGAQLEITSIPKIINAIMTGVTDNTPASKEIEGERPTLVPDPSTEESGGTEYGSLEEDALSLLEKS